MALTNQQQHCCTPSKQASAQLMSSLCSCKDAKHAEQGAQLATNPHVSSDALGTGGIVDSYEACRVTGRVRLVKLADQGSNATGWRVSCQLCTG